jgi:hypothetical protein
MSYTQDQINAMSVDQMKAALLAGDTVVSAPISAAIAPTPTVAAAPAAQDDPASTLPTITTDDIKSVVLAVLESQQPKAVSFTEGFLEKHQVSPQVAAAIAVSGIGGLVEIIKAILPMFIK